MVRFAFWQKWLFILGLLITVFGAGLSLLGGTPFQGPNSPIDTVFWGIERTANSVVDFQQWIYGVLGATMAGWGVFTAFIAFYPFKKRERWAWNCLIAGLLLWYVLDTAVSLNFKVYFNAVFNTVLMALGLLPLAFTREEFYR